MDTNLFRLTCLRSRQKLAEHTPLDARDNIFYLHWDEICPRAIGQQTRVTACANSFWQRRAEIEQVQNIELPEVIYGDEPPPVLPCALATRSIDRTPTSRGYLHRADQWCAGLQTTTELPEKATCW